MKFGVTIPVRMRASQRFGEILQGKKRKNPTTGNGIQENMTVILSS
jgi:hypothetical protein